jgi:hypothetical protein
LHAAVLEEEGNLPGVIVVGAVTALAGIIAAQEEEPETLQTSASLG